jgi:hypothetical protein
MYRIVPPIMLIRAFRFSRCTRAVKSDAARTGRIGEEESLRALLMELKANTVIATGGTTRSTILRKEPENPFPSTRFLKKRKGKARQKRITSPMTRV